MRRVVITGLGLITPLGNSVKETWENIKKGVSGGGYITKFPTEDFPVRIACEVKNFIPRWLDDKEAKRLDPFELYAISAAYEALDDAGYIKNGKCDLSNPERVGVIVGVGIGGLKTIEEGVRTLVEKGPRRVSPFFVPVSIANMAAGYISIKSGALGPCLSTTTACAAGLHSIGQAYEMVKFGRCDVVICGGAEAAITPIGIASFASMRALSQRNDSPQTASRPFDKTRDGFVMGEGSGILILESLENAKKRGAKIYGEILGFGMSADATHMTQPDLEGKGYALAMKNALEDAKISPEKIGYINAHGTSTKYNDEIETLAIKKVFGNFAYKIPVSSTKSMTGHLLGAAGAVETIFTVLSIWDNFIPPTINLEEPDDDCDLDYVPREGRESKIDFALCNSFGFGGTNGCLVIAKFK